LKIAGGEVVSVINRLKSEERTATTEEDMPTVMAAAAAGLVSTDELPENDRFVVPAVRPAQRTPRPRKPRAQKLQFEVPLDKFESVASHLGTAVVAEVGRRTFDYYYEREIEA
jgi:hypothetical protein